MKKVGNYIFQRRIGEGQFGKVYTASHEHTNELFAIKTVAKERINKMTKLRSLFETEMAVMSKIKHPNILHLHEYLETPNNYYLVIDYCNNGDLEQHVRKFKFLGEQESVYFLMQIMNGFRELHRHKIMHRDFKLANIFLNDDKIVIGDFGFAKSGCEVASTKLGSPITMAPELLNSAGHITYTNKADLWSIGVCFFEMIFGNSPWVISTIDDLKKKILVESGSSLRIPLDPPTTVECKDLLRRLIEPNPTKRIEWIDFFNHAIFRSYSNGIKTTPNMKQSVMFRNHEKKVIRIFQKNQERAKEFTTVKLISDPQKIKVDGTVNNDEYF